MVAFGVIILAGLCLGFGISASIYQRGERRWLLFAVQGALLLVAIAGLRGRGRAR